MKQVNQIGKHTKKDDVLKAKKGRTFVTPNNKEYIFDFEKIGNKYHFIVVYMGKRCRMNESDFNRTPIDTILNSIEQSVQDIENGLFD